MSDTSLQGPGDRMDAGDPGDTGGGTDRGATAPAPGSPDAVTSRTVEHHLQQRMDDLEQETADLRRSRDHWRTRAETASAELEWTRGQVSRLGRVIRVSMTVRRAVRRPRTIARLPVDISRALTAPVDAVRLPPAPGPAGNARPEAGIAGPRVIPVRLRSEVPARSAAGLRVAIVADQRLLDGFGPECRLLESDPIAGASRWSRSPPTCC